MLYPSFSLKNKSFYQTWRTNNKATIFFLTGLLVLLIYNLDLCKNFHMSPEQIVLYDRNSPLVFIGGVPGSGAGLLRDILNTHVDIRCIGEMESITTMLYSPRAWRTNEKERLRLEEAGVNEEVLDGAVAAFCIEVLALAGKAAPRLCQKDRSSLQAADYVSKLFPQSKFLFAVRDGRAAVHSFMSNPYLTWQIPLDSSFNFSNYGHSLMFWNRTVSTLYDQCTWVGRERCMMVRYEQLVLHPERWIRKIFAFLDISWDENVLKYDFNVNSLTKWVGKLPPDVVKNMSVLAPMLVTLGYDPEANPPNYGTPDTILRERFLFW